MECRRVNTANELLPKNAVAGYRRTDRRRELRVAVRVGGRDPSGPQPDIAIGHDKRKRTYRQTRRVSLPVTATAKMGGWR